MDAANSLVHNIKEMKRMGYAPKLAVATVLFASRYKRAMLNKQEEN
jgi:hypothetical protein